MQRSLPYSAGEKYISVEISAQIPSKMTVARSGQRCLAKVPPDIRALEVHQVRSSKSSAAVLVLTKLAKDFALAIPLINGYLSGLSRPEQVVHFKKTLGFPIDHSDDFLTRPSSPPNQR
jgi:hypothetical protein